MITALLAWLVAAVPHTAQAPAPQPFHYSIRPVRAWVKTDLKRTKIWQPNCPVGFSSLRVLTVTHRGWDGSVQTGQIVTNRAAAPPLAHVFHKLYRLRFPIHHMRLVQVYGGQQPADRDISGSFDCRQAVPSPCTGGKGTGSWSMHAYGMAIDINPSENPYVGCGMTHDPKTLSYADRSRQRKGMISAGVLRAFGSVGWGWGGSWPGSTKDYMHFSATGH